MNNIQFIEYTNSLIEKNIIHTYNINNENLILLDYISNTNLYTDNKSILKLNECKFIGTNIRHYFGYSDSIKNAINKECIKTLLSNVLIKYNDNYIWSDIIIKYYNKYFDSYNNKQIQILNKLLNEIKEYYQKLLVDIELLDKKKYDLDIVNKSVYEYMEENLNNIIYIFFEKIQIFYILSICYSNLSSNYLLIYNKTIINKLKNFI